MELIMTNMLNTIRTNILVWLGGVDRKIAAAETEWLDNQLQRKIERVSRMHQQIEDQIDEKEAMKQLLYVERGENNRLKREVSDLRAAKADKSLAYWQAQAQSFRKLFKQERESHNRTRMSMSAGPAAVERTLKDYINTLGHALEEAEDKLQQEYRMPLSNVDWRADTAPSKMNSTLTLRIKPEELCLSYCSVDLPAGLRKDMLSAELGGYFHDAFEKQVVPVMWDNYRHAYQSAITKLVRN